MPRKTAEELYEEQERALIGDAIRETEQEIHDSAFGNPADDNDGDTSLEQMDPDETLDDDNIEGEAEDEEIGSDSGDDQHASGEDEGEQPDEPDERQDRRGVPPGRLREETERRRAIEAERDAALARNREIEARLQTLERGQRPPNQQEQRPERPDIFADPEAWERQLLSGIEQRAEERRVNSSFYDAIEEHGQERFGEAYEALVNAGRAGDSASIAQVMRSPNPGRALISWHERQGLLRDIGNDPTAFIDRQIQARMSNPDFRRGFIDSMRSDAMRGEGGRGPRTRVDLPPSLNGSTGGTSHRGRDSNVGRDSARTSASIEREIFDSAFDDT